MSRAISIHDIDPSALGPNSPLLALMRRKPRRDLEHQMQTAVFLWASDSESKYPDLRWMFAVPNWIGVRTAKHGARLKAEGRRPGVPDILLPVRRGGWTGLAIELKAGKNRPSPEQKQWITHLESEGWRVDVLYSAESAIEKIKSYLETA